VRPATRRIAAGGALFLLAALGAALWLRARIERFLNVVEPVPLPAVSAAARALHRSSFVVDLHADSLLFGRDLLERSSVGHVDLPRLQEGGVALQIFTAATVTPFGLNIERNDRRSPDMLTFEFGLRSPLERALLQAVRLHGFISRSGGELLLVRSRADLEALLERRARAPRVVGAVLGVEGAHALESDLASLDVLFDAGFRMIGLTHFFDNEFAGSAHGVEKGGLTELGRQLLRRMEERGVLVDLAHASPATLEEALALATSPTVVSHGGVKGTCDNARNISDEHVRAIAAGGGVIGIGYWETAVCGREPRHIVAALRHVVDLVGDDHAALGSDYDGATTVGFDASRLEALTQEMLDEGLPPESIRKVLGGNALRLLRQTLPGG
jgi:microsomal dipeptidase-like Zn-dependent dipeptidase